MEQTIQTFRELLEENSKQTYGTMSEFVHAVEEMMQSNSDVLMKTLRGMENYTTGQRSATQGLSASTNKELQDLMGLKDIGSFFKESMQRFNQNTVNTVERDDPAELANLSKHLKVEEEDLIKIISGYCNAMEEMQNKIDLYNQAVDADAKHFEQLSPFEKLAWNMQRWGVAFEQNRKDFLKDVSNYQKQFMVSKEVAVKAVQKQYMGKGIPTAEFLDPAGQPGGAAAKATERQRFIRQLITGLVNSPLGKKITGLASEVVSMGALALVSNAPPWLQNIVLTAIYLGVPQAILSTIPTIISLMGTRFGRELITNALTRIGSVGRFLGPTAGAVGGLIAGGWVANALGSKVSGFIDNTGMNKSSKEGAKAISWGAIGVALGAALLGIAGIITSPFWAGVAAFASIGAIVVGIWQGIKHLIGWWKEKDNYPGWFAMLIAWWQDHMPAWLGGNKGIGEAGESGSDNTYIDKNGNEIVKADFKSNVPGGLTELYGSKLIDTSKYTKTQLNAMLPQNMAYESIAGGGKGWRTDKGSFVNDVMFAARGTSAILDSIATDPYLKDKLVVTSAFGSATSPHSQGSKSHYVGGGKLDFSLAGMDAKQRKAFQQKLLSTGYFEFADIEKQSDGGYHIDAKVKETTLKKLSDEAMAKAGISTNVPKSTPNTNKSGTDKLANSRANKANTEQ